MNVGYAARLSVVRESYRSGIKLWRKGTGASPEKFPPEGLHARIAGWTEVINNIQWSVTDDAHDGKLPSAAELRLWEKVRAHRTALVDQL